MTIRGSEIVARLVELLQGAGQVLPGVITVDHPEPGEWEDIGGGLMHTANLLRGKFTGTRDAGPVGEWEGVRELTFAYLVDGVSADARTARRDQAVPLLEAILASDRTLGLGDPQVWAELGDTSEDDDVPVPESTAVASAVITIAVTYVAASAAG